MPNLKLPVLLWMLLAAGGCNQVKVQAEFPATLRGALGQQAQFLRSQRDVPEYMVQALQTDKSLRSLIRQLDPPESGGQTLSRRQLMVLQQRFGRLMIVLNRITERMTKRQVQAPEFQRFNLDLLAALSELNLMINENLRVWLCTGHAKVQHATTASQMWWWERTYQCVGWVE